ncbi:MAG TPA: phenylacetate--CoA ligase, partial [Candidatus Obscuribacter sp.]|nr:phenylacetate--CoA ligase [Candidatus Obscuribacter sp.]
MATKSETYMWDRERETISRSDLKNLQLARLKQVLERVWHNVPTLKKRFQEAGIDETTISNLQDVEALKDFPFMKKSDLRDNYPFGLFASPMKEVNRLHCSSGTKGKPTVVGYT